MDDETLFRTIKALILKALAPLKQKLLSDQPRIQ